MGKGRKEWNEAERARNKKGREGKRVGVRKDKERGKHQ